MNPEIKAAIFDLDGVITETASLHARAWKQLFDTYNEERKNRGEKPYREFTIEEDYAVYIDGKPRYKGVNSFLESRQVELPYGDPDDAPGVETVCGLGNLKNEYFHKIIEEEGVYIIKENVQKLKEWRNKGLKTAIISSSKNCKRILKAAGVEDLFDVRIDGVVSRERNLKGKPDPDIFLEAARDLNVKPEESVVIEDALSGVEAGRKGNFRVVIGIGGNNHKEQMLEKGADVVVENLAKYDLFASFLRKENLPWAMDHLGLFADAVNNHNMLLCLDYDGTLTPIVEDFTKAFLNDNMRNTLKEVAMVLPIAIVSGRDLKFIKKQVDLEELFYAGSHGFEIEGPGNFYYEVDESQEILPVLDNAEEELHKRFAATPGVEIERKKYAIAIHYRKVMDEDLSYVKDVVEQILSKNPKLKKGGGKKIIELKPNLDWDKGKAVEVLSRQIPVENEDEPVHIIYIGDDDTDEDAFRVIKDGYGILVGDPDQETFAHYYLNDVDEVNSFLSKITTKDEA